MILPLQSLRFVAATCIFLSHLQFFPEHYVWIYDTFFRHLYIGVSYFFMLSGFVLTRRYFQVFQRLNIATLLTYWRKRIRRIYPIHILTFLLSFPVTSLVFYTSPILVANILLFQSLIPDPEYYYYFNSMSWFLADLVVLYLLFPFIVRVLAVFGRNNSARLLTAIALLAFYTATYFTINRHSLFTQWVFYISPWVRVIDFATGMILGLIVLALPIKKKTVITRVLDTTLEFSAFIIAFFFLKYAHDVPQAYRYSLYFIPPVAFIIFFFATSRGVISLLLSHRRLVYFGSISFPFLMFHWLIIRYGTIFAPDVLRTYPGMAAVSTFVLSVCLGIIFNRMSHVWQRIFLRFPSASFSRDKESC